MSFDWSQATPSDTEWAKTAGSHSVTEVVADNNGLRFRYLLAKDKVSRELRQDILLTVAIPQGKAEIVKAIIDVKGFDLCTSSDADRINASALLRLAARHGELDIAMYLAEKSMSLDRYPKISAILNIFFEEDFIDGVAALLKKENPADNTAFSKLLVTAAKHGALRTVQVLVPYIDFFNDVQSTLNDALLAAARAGSADICHILMHHGANPNTADGSAFAAAAEWHNVALIEDMYAHGLRLDLYGLGVLETVRQMKEQSPVVAYLESELPKAAAKYFKEQPANEHYRLEGPHIMSDTVKIAGGMKLTTVFNFERQQQILVVETTSGAVSASQTDFSAMDPGVVAAMEAKLVSLGGVPCGVTGFKANIFKFPSSEQQK